MLKAVLKRRARRVRSLATMICFEFGSYTDMSEYNDGEECYRGEYNDGLISIEFSNEPYGDPYCSISDSLGTVYTSHVNTLLAYQPGEWEKHLRRIGRIAETKRRDYRRAIVGETGCTVKGRSYYACMSPEIYF